MKLVRFGEPGRERPGLIDPAGRIRDISGHISDIGGIALLPDYLTAIERASPANLPIVDPGVRLGPCVASVGKIIGIGLNYSDLLDAIEMEQPDEPAMFLKATSAICGPNDGLILPEGSKKIDWEVELGVVIGRPGSHIAGSDAFHHIAGYCIVNDYSERNYEMPKRVGGLAQDIPQWTVGKNADSFAPLGPWLVTADEIADPQALDIWLEIDGHRHQDSHTSRMTFSVAELISRVSRYMSLHTGDVIMTGTPYGTGISLTPETYLRPGQVVRAGISGLGEQCQTVDDLRPAQGKAEAKGKSAAETPQLEYNWQAIYTPST
ncbi:MAG TPA: fumarylacetoacetate hydrolase family protein [Alphaproteobacteria bacterium]|nr:fumarylacetoacetate hydrolase family protein [Alphaproteobacteria bacterium]